MVLAATSERALDVVPLSALQEHAVDVPADPGQLTDRRDSQVVRVVGERLAAVLGDEQQVLEADAADPVDALDARLDRDHVAGDERARRRRGRGPGGSCTSRPTPWPSPK